MPGKKKKREKHSGLSLSRIGACLVPGAIFAAVPSTAQSFSETWPRRKKNLSALSTALGSVGNLAQAIVVGETPREGLDENAGTSNDRLEDYEDYESDGHYAVVDETIFNGSKSKSEENGQAVDKPPVEAIYATVNKKPKPQVAEKNWSSSSGSEDDITSVSGMSSEEEDSSAAVNHHLPASKTYSSRRNSKKRRSGKEKSKKYSPRNIPEQIEEEPIVKTDINDNILLANADFADDYMEEPYSPKEPYSSSFKTVLQNEFFQSTENTQEDKSHSTGREIQRNFNSPSAFEREQFNESTLYEETDGGSPPFHSRRDAMPLGASTSDLAAHSPDVPPIGERETPIGKGMSSESIYSSKERWHTLAQPARKQDPVNESRDKHRTLEENHQDELEPEQQSDGLQQQSHDQQRQHKKKRKKQQQVEQQQQHVPSQQQNYRKQFSQSAQLVRQQLEVANKLRALSAPGQVKDSFQNPISKESNISGENVYPSEIIDDSQESRQENHRSAMHSESDHPEVKSMERRNVDIISGEQGRHSQRFDDNNSSKRRKKKSKNKEERPTSVQETPRVDNSQTATLQQMSTTMAKEACKKLYLQVKTLDREKSALESLSQSLNEENTTLKKLNDSLTKNVDTSHSGISIGLLQMQIEELKQENTFLKDSVHRLNVELGRYQAKYRPLSTQEVEQMFKTEENQPAWLINKKYIAPLLLAYDDRIKEKQAIVQTYEEQLKSFKDSLRKIIEENVQLQKKLGNSEAITRDEEEWQQLEKQAKLVLSENEVLMERQELQGKKLEEITAFYKGEVFRLSQQYEKAEVEKSGLESKLEVMSTTLNGYKQEFETSATQWKKHVSVEEHLDTVNECRRKLGELRQKTQEEIDSLTFQLESVRNENNSLTLQLADVKLANTQLEREVHSFTEVQRKNERKTLFLKEKLDHLQQREAAAQDTLNEVLKVAEKTTLERDALNEILTSKQLENKKVHSLVKMEEDKLKECKNKASIKITAIKGRVKEQERTTEMLKDRYENEIKNLKTLIRRQQMQLEDMVNDKRNLENELHVIYEKIADNSDKIEDVT